VQFKDYIGRVTMWGTKFVSVFQNFPSSARRDPFEDLDIECTPFSRGVPLSPGPTRPQKCSSCICLTHNSIFRFY
jgi:hypothetical protein